jgi:MinD-like ATPase involved in chromosome partitioning or flagellar assembly
VLSAPPAPERRARLEEGDYRSVALWLRRFAGLLIVDCGPDLRAPATRAAVDCADQVLVVTDAVEEAGPALGQTVDDVRRQDRSVIVVANGLRRPVASRVVRRLAVSAPEADGLVTMPWSPAGATQLRAGAFDWSTAPAEWVRSAHELAAVLVADWSRLGVLA